MEYPPSSIGYCYHFYPPYLDSMNLLLLLPHDCVTEHREIKFILTWNHNPHFLKFFMLERPLHTAQRKRNHQSESAGSPERQNNDNPDKRCPVLQQWHKCFRSIPCLNCSTKWQVTLTEPKICDLLSHTSSEHNTEYEYYILPNVHMNKIFTKLSSFHFVRSHVA